MGEGILPPSRRDAMERFLESQEIHLANREDHAVG
jgi:hypothetical protein